MSVSPSRRQLLQAALVTPLAAACSSHPKAPPRPDPDDALRRVAIGLETSLLQMYDAAIAAAPPARALALRAVQADHVEHLRALHGTEATATPTPQPSANQVTGEPPTAARLVEFERGVAAQHAAAALSASRRLAAVLASLAASEASHPVALQ